MKITIDLPADAAQKLREQAAQKGTTLEDHLAALAFDWAGTNGTSAQTIPPKDIPVERWLKEFREFVDSHKHITAIADDSRESIY